jgi:hypothetical protein
MDCFATLYLRIFFWATRILILHMKRMKCRFSIFLIKLVEACRGLQAIKNVALLSVFTHILQENSYKENFSPSMNRT